MLANYLCCIFIVSADLSKTRAELYVGQCISSKHPCPPPHLPTSVPILAGLRGWSPASFSSVFPFPFSLPEPSSSLVWLFYPCSSWSYDRTTSLLLFLLLMQLNSSCPVLSLIVLFDILSLHETRKILLSHL